MGSCKPSLYGEPISEERSAGNPHATILAVIGQFILLAEIKFVHIITRIDFISSDEHGTIPMIAIAINSIPLFVCLAFGIIFFLSFPTNRGILDISYNEQQ